MSKFAWVTLTTNDAYSLGALVLAHSLKRAGTAYQMAVLVTPGVSEPMKGKLKDVYNVVQEVDVMDSRDAANLALLARPELGITFTKLHCWRLIQFEKCVFLDSDTLVLQNCDELFEREELSAAPDVSWPDCFNSGVFVYHPSLDTFTRITEVAMQSGSFDGGDQGLLNSYFSNWAHGDITKHLPFIYNVTAYASYCYMPAFKQFKNNIKILHFAGKMKPWLIHFNSQTRTAVTPADYAHAADLIQLWWNIFCDNVHQTLTNNMNCWSPIASLPNGCPVYQCQDNKHSKSHIHNQCMSKEDAYQEIIYNSRQYMENDREQSIYEGNHPPAYCQFSDILDIKSYHDPWKDYYQNFHNVLNEIEADCSQCTITNEIHEEINEVCNCEHSDFENDTKHADITRNNVTEIMPCCQDLKDSFVNVQEITISVDIKIVESRNLVNDEIIKLNSQTIIENNASTCKNSEDICGLKQNEDCTENEVGLAGALSHLRLGEKRTPEQDTYEQLMRRQCWESGQIDYTGKDSFDNIWKRITQTLETKPPSAEDVKSDRLVAINRPLEQAASDLLTHNIQPLNLDHQVDTNTPLSCTTQNANRELYLPYHLNVRSSSNGQQQSPMERFK